MKGRLTAAVPPFTASLAPMLLWAVTCGLTCMLMLVYARGWSWTAQTTTVAMIYGFGAAFAFWPSIFAVRLVFRAPSIARLLAIFLLLALGTMFVTAVIFVLEYRVYYAQWHGEAFSRLWLWQQFFTSATAVYFYLVLGLRLYIPVAIFVLFVASWWVNRLPD